MRSPRTWSRAKRTSSIGGVQMPGNFNVKLFLVLSARNCISLKMSTLMNRERWKCLGQKYGMNVTTKMYYIQNESKATLHLYFACKFLTLIEHVFLDKDCHCNRLNLMLCANIFRWRLSNTREIVCLQSTN